MRSAGYLECFYSVERRREEENDAEKNYGEGLVARLRPSIYQDRVEGAPRLI